MNTKLNINAIPDNSIIIDKLNGGIIDDKIKNDTLIQVSINNIMVGNKPYVVYKNQNDSKYTIDYTNKLSDDITRFTSDYNVDSILLLDCTDITDFNDIFGGTDYGLETPSILKEVTFYNGIPNYNKFDRTFGGLTKLERVNFVNFDTSSIDRMQFTFKRTSLYELDLSMLDLSKLIYIPQCFSFNYNLKWIKFPTNTASESNKLDLHATFSDCTSLEYIDFSMLNCKITRFHSAFLTCLSIHTINMGNADFSECTDINTWSFSGCNELVNLYGMNNVKKSYNLNYSSKLSYESAMRCINGLYDLTEGGTVSDYTAQTLTFNATTKALLSNEDIAIATNKGWNIA